MGKRVEALVKPELIVWARTSAGLSVEEAAKKIQVKPERLDAWEAGEARPTINQLRKLGNVYKRPIAVFYLAEPPKDFQAMHDFRRLPGEVAGIESPQLRLEIRKARYRRQIAVELFEELGEEPAPFELTASTSERTEAVAERARTALGITYDVQTGWRTAYDALNGWRTAIEELGVLVFQAVGVDVAEMRGFSLADSLLPTIVVNIKDSPRGRVFTMMHELVHLMLHEEGLCDLTEDPSSPPEERSIEIFCNRVAGEILVPEALLLSEKVVVRRSRSAAWSDEEIGELARRYQVSREVILRRLLLLGRTTEAFYRTKRKEFIEAYREARATRAEGFAPPDRIAVSSAGHLFVRLVLDSFYQERITSSDVSDYLGVRLKWMPKIEQAVRGSAMVS